MAVEGDSYCATADVVALVQLGAYGAGTVPTAAQGLEFQQDRAMEIYSWMVEALGTSAPGPAAFNTTIDTGTDAGVALDALCKQANAQGAAADSLEAAGASSTPARTERVTELLTMFFASKDGIQAVAKLYDGGADTAKNAFTEGRVTTETITSHTEDGFEFDGETVW